MSIHPHNLTCPVIVDSFAGGGGASTGIEMALGRSPDVAINHSADALAMHEVNHPETVHLDSNIWDVSPREVTKGRHLGLLWASPDCKHFSNAKDGKPMDRNVRDLAWVVVKWAEEAKPDVIILENVEEFRTWGPLYDDGKPIVEFRGQTFDDWMKQLKQAGYKVEWRELVAWHYGAPTIRKRFFMIARRDRRPIVWPKRTHGNPKVEADAEVIAAGKLKPWRTAGEIIDWSLPCPSIFDTAEAIKAKHGVRAVRPLAPATMKRIARGVVRYVLESARPYIVKFQSGATGHALDEPLATVTANSFVKRPGGAAPLGLVVPSLATLNHGGGADHAPKGLDEPFRTVTAARDAHALIAPSIVRTDMASAAARNGVHSPDKPLNTLTTAGSFAVVAPVITAAQHGGSIRAADEPVDTVMAGAPKFGVVSTFLAQHNNDARRIGGVNPGRPADEPLATLTTAGAQQAVVAAHMMRQFGTSTGHDLDESARTDTATANKSALIFGFLTKYYGTGDGARLDDPMPTDTTKDRFGLVTVKIGGETFAIADIGMRMLTPRERFRAQGFPDSYIIDRRPDGWPLSATVQGSCCGNSVCPPLAAALVSANCAHLMAAPVMEAAE